jgi:hypothetical protein
MYTEDVDSTLLAIALGDMGQAQLMSEGMDDATILRRQCWRIGKAISGNVTLE